MPPSNQPQSAVKRALDVAYQVVNDVLVEWEYQAESYFDDEIDIKDVLTSDGHIDMTALPDLIIVSGEFLAVQYVAFKFGELCGPGAGLVAEQLGKEAIVTDRRVFEATVRVAESLIDFDLKCAEAISTMNKRLLCYFAEAAATEILGWVVRSMPVREDVMKRANLLLQSLVDSLIVAL
jgi:hypothetical protein